MLTIVLGNNLWISWSPSSWPTNPVKVVGADTPGIRPFHTFRSEVNRCSDFSPSLDHPRFRTIYLPDIVLRDLLIQLASKICLSSPYWAILTTCQPKTEKRRLYGHADVPGRFNYGFYWISSVEKHPFRPLVGWPIAIVLLFHPKTIAISEDRKELIKYRVDSFSYKNVSIQLFVLIAITHEYHLIYLNFSMCFRHDSRAPVETLLLPRLWISIKSSS